MLNMIRNLAVTLLLLGLMTGHGWADAQLADAQPPTATPSQGVRFELATDKTAYEVGEPIELHIRLINGETTPFSVEGSNEISGWWDGYLFPVHSPDGKLIAHQSYEFGYLMNAIGGARSIPPGETYTRTFLLNYRIPALKPGKYTVQGICTVKRLPLASSIFKPVPHTIKIESPVTTFEVVATSTAAIQDRVLRLTEQLRSALDDPSRYQRDSVDFRRLTSLLGFTGADSAIAPLVDSFYLPKDKIEALYDAQTAFSLMDHICYSAASALLHLNGDKVKAALLRSMRERGYSPNGNDRMMYLLLVQLNPRPQEVVPTLLKLLNDKSATTRSQALRGLGLSTLLKGEHPYFLPAAIARLKDTDSGVRSTAGGVVGLYSTATALKALQAAADDENVRVRQVVIASVGRIGQKAAPGSKLRKAAMETLLRKLQSPDYQGAAQAANTLGRIGDKGSVDTLKKVLASATDPELRRAVEQALKINVPRS